MVQPGSGSSIQNAINSNPAGTTFCLGGGIFNVASPITPKSGDSFIGVYGATLDGNALPSTDPNTGIFRAHNQDIDDVTIRNLVLRNSPRSGIHAFTDHSDRWVIANNEIVGNRMGIQHGDDFRIHDNAIHHNWQYGIGGYRSHGTVISDNEFAFNASRFLEFPGDSATSKWVLTRDTTVRGNYVHDNYWSGIWFDGENTGVLIEENLVVDNGGNGIFHEVSGQAVIRNNTIEGSSQRNIYISESHDTDIYGNTVRGSSRGISLFQDGNRIWESELVNNSVHDNTVVVPTGGLAVSLTCSNLSSSQCLQYSTSRGNRFDANRYVVPTMTGRWWTWANGQWTWTEWRAQGQDPSGTFSTA